MNVGTGDFTIDMNLKLAQAGFLGIRRTGQNYLYLEAMDFNGGWRPRIQLTNESGTAYKKVTFETDDAFPLQAWAHVAFQRRGGSIAIYVDGVSQQLHLVGGACCSSGSSDPSGYTVNNTGYWLLGTNSESIPNPGTGTFPGILGGFRYTSSAAYDGTFTPTYPLQTLPSTVVNLLLTEGTGTALTNDAPIGPAAYVDTDAAWVDDVPGW